MNKKLIYVGSAFQIPNVIFAIILGMMFIDWNVDLIGRIAFGVVFGLINIVSIILIITGVLSK